MMDMIKLTNNLTLIKTEVWFIPIDILMIITTILSIIFGLIFLLIVITRRTCWSVPMLLNSNSCLAEILVSCVLLSMALFTFQRDWEQNTENISLCIIQGFLSYIVGSMQNYSFLLTAMYRYISVVYPTQLWWQSIKSQLCLIIGTWLFCILISLVLLLTEQIVYNIDNQICQVPLGFTIPYIYITIILYVIPNIGIIIIYSKLARYIRQMSNRIVQSPTLFHARRELRLVQRTFIQAITLIILGTPYLIFTFISFFTTPPKYHFRIAYIFIDISILLIMIMFYYFTQQVREIVQTLLSTSDAVESVVRTVRSKN